MLLRGLDLQYTGEKVTDFGKGPGSKSEKLKIALQNIGAFVMRVQLAQAQRIALLESTIRHNYTANPVEIAGPGGDEPGLFTPENSASATHRATRRLEQYAHYTLGKGKILNERAQPQKNRNVKGLRGEEYLWDSLHAPVWTTGLNLPGQLCEQGFIYVCHPENMMPAEYERVTAELQQGRFKIINRNDQPVVLVESGVELKTDKFSCLDIALDIKFERTTQKNGFVIISNGSCAPVGWSIHMGKENKLVDSQYTQDILRVMKIARGGSHKLTKEEFDLLLVKNNRGCTTEIRHTQNRNLTLVEDVTQALERDFGFDGSGLLGKLLKVSYDTIQKKSQESDVMEDFLTGALITEMVQSLKLTQPKSTRSKLPYEFSDSFDSFHNINKAFAYAFDLKKPDGSPAFVADAVPFSVPDCGLIDVRMRGTLAEPDLTNPRHVAALISSGVLVAEQMLLEQLLRDAVVYGDNHAHAKALKQILNNDGTYQNLLDMARKLPCDANGPIMGLQVPASEPMLEVLRNALGFNHLIKMADELYRADGITTINENDKNASLRKLYQIGKILQSLEGISAAPHGSRGINAGIIPVIARIAPALHAELVATDQLVPAPGKSIAPMRKMSAEVVVEEVNEQQVVKEQKSGEDLSRPSACPVADPAATVTSGGSCPFASVVTREAADPSTNTARGAQKHWCQFFSRNALPVGIALGVGAAACFIAAKKTP